MIPEDDKSRSGEPVIFIDVHSMERKGTIEFGSETMGLISIHREDGGGRVILRGSKELLRVRSDPGGARPKWEEQQRWKAKHNL